MGESQILGEWEEKIIELKILFRGTKKPGTAGLSLGGGHFTKTVPGWWTKIF
jgi:hypothetical protein